MLILPHILYLLHFKEKRCLIIPVSYIVSQTVRIVPKKIKNSTAALGVCLLGIVCLLMIWKQAEWPAGGQDSWNHYLFARFAPQHPELILDQWAKTLFTLPAIPFAQMGINGVIVMNLLCIFFTAYFSYLCARRLDMKYPWLAAAFFLFHPIVFSNGVSSLTEPLNALVLVVIFYLYITERNFTATVLASLLPYFRSEGYVLLIAFIIYLLAFRKWKFIPLLFTGMALFMLIGYLVYNNWFWVFSSNPYVEQEIKGTFRPMGALFHYIRSQKGIWGIPITLMLCGSVLILAVYTFKIVKRRTTNIKMSFNYWLVLPLFLGFLLVHSIIWYLGSMGSHGLTRVFFMVAPATALLATLCMDWILSFDIKIMNRFLPVAILPILVYTAYKGSDTPWPWKKTVSIPGYKGHQNIEKALSYIQNSGIKPTVIMHQLPYLNAVKNWDPFEKDPDKKQTDWIWSIPRKEEDKDWTKAGAVVIWDNYHALRDAQMPVNILQHKPGYKELTLIKMNTEPGDSIYDIHVFLKEK